jgi:hypothetical protein
MGWFPIGYVRLMNDDRKSNLNKSNLKIEKKEKIERKCHDYALNEGKFAYWARISNQ